MDYVTVSYFCIIYRKPWVFLMHKNLQWWLWSLLCIVPSHQLLRFFNFSTKKNYLQRSHSWSPLRCWDPTSSKVVVVIKELLPKSSINKTFSETLESKIIVLYNELSVYVYYKFYHRLFTSLWFYGKSTYWFWIKLLLQNNYCHYRTSHYEIGGLLFQ